MSQVTQFLRDEQDLPPSRNKNSWMRRIFLFVFVLGVVVGGVWLFATVRALTFTDDYVGEGTGTVTVTIEDGATLRQMGETLQAAGVVQTADAFVRAAEANEDAVSIGPGTYDMRQQMSADAAVAWMLDPRSRAGDRLVLPEGLRMSETVAISSKTSGIPEADFEDALRKPGDLDLPDWADGKPEGFLFPATYDISPEMDATDILKLTVDRFDVAMADTDFEARAKKIGYTPYEVLIVASLVEAEGIPSDFPSVARVIYNRLEEGMPLQLDSTVNYALGTREIQLSAEQLAVDSPYNTYANEGLPPGPINSPGEAAMEAALSPARGDWLYFVTVNPDTGETKFTASYDEFLKFKQELRDYLRTRPSPSGS
ncbi:MAG: endolytic transglycosylase MltG [Candidatus Nanopelagicales bacterium]